MCTYVCVCVCEYVCVSVCVVYGRVVVCRRHKQSAVAAVVHFTASGLS